ncbi:MAG: hypothetical protein ABI967_14565 [bacterium]
MCSKGSLGLKFVEEQVDEDWNGALLWSSSSTAPFTDSPMVLMRSYEVNHLNHARVVRLHRRARPNIQ